MRAVICLIAFVAGFPTKHSFVVGKDAVKNLNCSIRKDPVRTRGMTARINGDFLRGRTGTPRKADHIGGSRGSSSRHCDVCMIKRSFLIDQFSRIII